MEERIPEETWSSEPQNKHSVVKKSPSIAEIFQVIFVVEETSKPLPWIMKIAKGQTNILK